MGYFAAPFLCLGEGYQADVGRDLYLYLYRHQSSKIIKLSGEEAKLCLDK